MEVFTSGKPSWDYVISLHLPKEHECEALGKRIFPNSVTLWSFLASLKLFVFGFTVHLLYILNAAYNTDVFYEE